MRKSSLKEVTIKLPTDLVETFSNKEILSMMKGNALSKAEYYRSRCKEFEERYTMGLGSFRKKVEGGKEENFVEWDDLIVWEGFELGYKEWQKKYRELKACMK